MALSFLLDMILSPPLGGWSVCSLNVHLGEDHLFQMSAKLWHLGDTFLSHKQLINKTSEFIFPLHPSIRLRSAFTSSSSFPKEKIVQIHDVTHLPLSYDTSPNYSVNQNMVLKNIFLQIIKRQSEAAYNMISGVMNKFKRNSYIFSCSLVTFINFHNQ